MSGRGPQDVDRASPASDAEALHSMDDVPCRRVNTAVRTIYVDGLGRPAGHGTGTAPLAVMTAAPSGLRTKARKRATADDGAVRVSSSERRVSG